MVWAFQLNLSVMSWVGLLVGMFLIYNTIAFAVAQRRREIGIYRALGMTERRVAGLFLVEAGLLGLLGGLLGGLGGVWLASGLVSLVSRTVSDLYAPVASGGLILSMDMLTFTSVMKGVLLGTVVSMLGALGPSVEAGRTVTVRALAPGDYESTHQLRAGLWGWISLGLLVLAGLCSLMGPIGEPAALWLSRDDLSLGGAFLSCADLYQGIGTGGIFAGKAKQWCSGEPPAHRGRPGGASSGPECGDGIGVDGGIVDHDRCGRHGSQFFVTRSSSGWTRP